jgi:hypothetical protein
MPAAAHRRLAAVSLAILSLLACVNARAEETTPAAQLTAAGAPMPAIALTDAHVDFDAARDAWGRRMDYHALCESSLPLNPWAEAETAKDYARAYNIAATWLAMCPVVERVHMWAYGDAKALGDVERMELHKRWYQGLIASVMKTGDGKTPETAFKTISVAEEYAIVQALGMQRGAQALLQHPRVDKLTVKRQSDGTEVVLYFNPELHFARLSRELAPK